MRRDTVLNLTIAAYLLYFALLGGIIYIAVHFIRKWW